MINEDTVKPVKWYAELWEKKPYVASIMGLTLYIVYVHWVTIPTLEDKLSKAENENRKFLEQQIGELRQDRDKLQTEINILKANK